MLKSCLRKKYGSTTKDKTKQLPKNVMFTFTHDFDVLKLPCNRLCLTISHFYLVKYFCKMFTKWLGITGHMRCSCTNYIIANQVPTYRWYFAPPSPSQFKRFSFSKYFPPFHSLFFFSSVNICQGCRRFLTISDPR